MYITATYTVLNVLQLGVP